MLGLGTLRFLPHTNIDSHHSSNVNELVELELFEMFRRPVPQSANVQGLNYL
jgi:hypothetical protein